MLALSGLFITELNTFSSYLYSVSGSSATIFVYLSEFHDNKRRSHAIMVSAVVYGILINVIPWTALIVINQEWQFDVPFIGVTYKPWRFFMVVCAFPAFISFLILLFLPESPKFVLSQGEKERTLKILQRMNRINNGQKSEFEKFEIIEEFESIENRRRILKCKESRFPLFESIKIQTLPLFKRQHLLSTVLLCIIQFGIAATSFGVVIFMIEILNKMALNLDSFVDDRAMMCDVINMNPTNLTAVHESTQVILYWMFNLKLVLFLSKYWI